jgi:hypothetical protein
LETISIGTDFLNRTPAAKQLKRKNGQMGLHEIKSFCTMKEKVCKLKRPPTDWEKIFTGYTSDKGLITRPYKSSKN